ncbi:hypothetical protein [Tenacibaculum ovolyticum]|uniref:hypothetical protein n=1 Tax=Tenacibaculum ovolyticum TaxID=104270 RepID=UPI00041A6A0E|nr:hypothetical protein [Tenacibaculum ovolyticum]
MEKLKRHIGLIIAIIFAFFDGTLGLIELFIIGVLTYIIGEIFKRKIAEAIANVNGYANVGNLLNNYFFKDKKKNGLVDCLIGFISDAVINNKQEEFNRKMKLWTNITEVSVFILFTIISIIIDF